VVRTVGVNELVVVHCANPKERLWGVVLKMDSLGLVVRGLALESAEDWLSQHAYGSEREVEVGPSTVFLPIHRIERVYLDESTGPVESLGERFADATGRDARDELVGEGTDS
jgi:hypothetical protein